MAQRHLLVVLEQSVLHAEERIKLLRVLTKNLGIAPATRRMLARAHVAIAVTVEDIERALEPRQDLDGEPTLSALARRQRRCRQNPLLDLDETRRCCEGLFNDLQAELIGTSSVPRRAGLLGRLLARKWFMLNALLKKPEGEVRAQPGCALPALTPVERGWKQRIYDRLLQVLRISPCSSTLESGGRATLRSARSRAACS